MSQARSAAAAAAACGGGGSGGGGGAPLKPIYPPSVDIIKYDQLNFNNANIQSN